jgi:arylsulfatase A-like enzyme
MASQRPNIVFILADDLGWCDLGAAGSTYYESPNIDRIAHEGMKFTQAYASCQVCSPTRASILTGQDTPRHGITDYLGAGYGEKWRGNGRCDMMLPAPYAPGLKSDTVTFAEVMRRNGYKTFFAGKWHLGEKEDGVIPENFGFEINKGGYRAGGPRSYFSPYQNPALDDGPPGESLPIRLGQETAEFIEATTRSTGSGQEPPPFLAYLSFYSVHCPLQTTKARWEKFQKKALELDHKGERFIMDRKQPVRQVQDHPIYAGVIEAMDDGVGLVLDALEKAGIADNTIVVFTSDNGGVSSGDDYASSMLPLRGGKGRQWEGGIREPLFVRYPAMIKEGTLCDTPVISQDFYPTFMEMTGCEIPESQVG